ncbi:MAG: alpha/beta hydrolase [Actinomycetota bacterium]
MPDIISIDPAAGLDAAASVGHEVRGLVMFTDEVREIDRGGGDLATHTTPTLRLLDEVAEELRLLAAALDVAARAAIAADTLDSSSSTALWRAAARRWSTELWASLHDDIGVTTVDISQLGRWRPDRVRAWWESLDAGQRIAAVHQYPDVIGTTDGIPLSVRIDANHVTITHLTALPDHDPRLDQYLDPAGRPDRSRQIVLLDLRGDGLVAELIGDLATATSLAVVIPGMGSELANASVVGDDARRLQGGHDDLAVIAWTGYDAPKGLVAPDSLGDLWRDLVAADEVASDELARAGARRLAWFGAALDLELDVPTTYLGHSYGSLTLGLAIRGGLTGSRAVFLGSPGVGVDSTSDFPALAFLEYFAADAHGDPVADLQRFGDAPTDPDFGAQTFDVGDSDGVFLQLHDDYFENDVAIANLRTIVRGGSPSPDRPSLAARVGELLDDLGVRGAHVVENAGEHLEDLADDLASGAVDVADWLDETFHDSLDAAVSGLEILGGSALDGLEWMSGWPPSTLRDLLPDPLGWFD